VRCIELKEFGPSLLFAYVSTLTPSSNLQNFYPTTCVATLSKRAKAEPQPAALDPNMTPVLRTSVGSEDKGSQRAQRKNHWWGLWAAWRMSNRITLIHRISASGGP